VRGTDATSPGSPELKRSLEELQKTTSGLAEKCVAARVCLWRAIAGAEPAAVCRAREGVAETAGKAREELGQQARKAGSAARSAVGDAPEELLRAVRRLRCPSALERPLTRPYPPAQASQGASDTAELLKRQGRSLLHSLKDGAGQNEEGAEPPPNSTTAQGAPSASSRLRAGLLSLRAMAVRGVKGAEHAVRAEVRLAMMDPGDAVAERARERAAAMPGPAAGLPVNRSASELSVVKPRVSAWQQRWGTLLASASPLFSRLGAAAAKAGDAPVVRKTREVAEDMRERWETSDSPLVHKLQDLGDALRIQETDAARAMAVILSREPQFDMHDFVATCRRDVPHILGAYLRADLPSLKAAHVAPELLERLGAMMRVWLAEGTVMDSNVLDVADLEVVEVKFVGTAPMIVLQFTVQQINCVRDQLGVVVEGAADDVQSVYYAWAMEQVPPVANDHEARATWRLRDLMVRGMHAIT